MTMEVDPTILTIAREVAAAGGRAYLVGGAVRDHLLGIASKDLDVEIHGIELDATEALLRKGDDAADLLDVSDVGGDELRLAATRFR